METGNANWEFLEVLSGLAEGDRVLVSLDAEGVKEGVRAVERAKPVPSPRAASAIR